MVPNMVQRAKNFYYPIWVWCQKFFIGAKNFCSVPMVPKKKLDLDELRHYIRYIMSRRDHMSLDIARPRFNKEKNSECNKSIYKLIPGSEQEIEKLSRTIYQG